MRIVWAVALFAAALAFAPTAAEAHAGHSHAQTAAPAHQPAQPADVVAVAAKVTQSLTAAPSNTSPSSTDAGCDGQGCCSSGPCTGHGFVLTTLPVTLPPVLSTPLVVQDVLPHGSPDVGRLRRPPKSFA